jgi:hypothetical protein
MCAEKGAYREISAITEKTPDLCEGSIYLDLYLGQYIEEVADEVLSLLCNMSADDVEIVRVYSTPEDIDFSVGVVIKNPDVLDRVTDKIATYEAIDKSLAA